MSTKPYNEPAFPVSDLSQCQYPGASLRDYFAAKAMQGFMARADWADQDWSGEACAAYRVADAMLAAREATQ